MRFVVSGGGTAGHINPALALCEEFRTRGHSVDFAGTPQGVEARLVPQAGVPFTPFEASGFNRSHPTTLIKALGKLRKSKKEARAWLAETKPQAVIGFGGYVSLPVGMAACDLGIPLVIHEQNSVMGMANERLSKQAAAVCLTYACAGSPEFAAKTVVTGNPVRQSIVTADREEGRKMLGIPQDARMLLVFGGSLGARHVNTAIIQMKGDLLSRQDLYLVHITGPKEYDAVVGDLALTERESQRWQVMGYQDRMGETLAAADAIVSRAGASSLAEISALGIPALLVPFPHATADHQTMNARALVDSGCAIMIADDQVEGAEFRGLVLQLVDDAEMRGRMRHAALGQETGGAAARLADVVMDVLQ